jgi:nicotinamide mononucleotide transporter
MTWLSNVLWHPVFQVFGVPITVVELIGFVTGAWCVWLVGRQNPWNWPIGLVQVVAYLALFWQAGLFADSALQGVFLILGLWGWWNWLRRRPIAEPLLVRRTTGGEWLALAVIGLVGTVVIYSVLSRFTHSTVPVADASTTILSLLATYGQGRKLLESWWLWIAADVIYVPLYGVKSLWLTALLYAGFLVLCLVGLRRWKATLGDEPVFAEQAATA